MTVVGIDTAGRLGGIGIVSHGRLLGAQALGVEEGHSQNLLPSLEALMQALRLGPGDISGVAVAVGPGSYTGLRIGVAVAKGLAYAWGVPVRGVSTLLATAWPLCGVRGVVCASLDARKDHVFSATFAGRRLGETPDTPDTPLSEALIAPEDRRSVEQLTAEIEQHLAHGDDVYLVGDGASLVYAKIVDAQGVSRRGDGPRIVVSPLQGEAQRAAHVAHIGEIELMRGRADDLFELSPNYLRRSEAERRWRQKL